MQAPTPFMINKELHETINLNDLKDKEKYTFNEYNLIVGLHEEKIILICENNENSFQVSKTYEEITKDIPNFKASENINSIYILLNRLFKSNKYQIKNEDENKLKIIVKIKDMLGNDENHEIILNQKELDVNSKMESMKKTIKILEKKVEELTKENNEIKKNVEKLTKENDDNKKKIDILYNLYGNNSFIFQSDKIDSMILKNKNEIDFVLEEIEKKIGKKNNIKLIYRATRDSDLSSQFHSKCDNIQNTIMIVKTSGGYKFGGFTSTGWKNEKGKYISDSNAFCFSINLHKIYNIINPNRAMYNQSTDGSPSFGGSSNYIFRITEKFLNNDRNFVDKMKDYGGEIKEYEINGGNYNFKVDELEVFQIY